MIAACKQCERVVKWEMASAVNIRGVDVDQLRCPICGMTDNEQEVESRNLGDLIKTVSYAQLLGCYRNEKFYIYESGGVFYYSSLPDERGYKLGYVDAAGWHEN